MVKPTIIISVLLIILGIGGYFGSGMASWTALLPSIFGAALLICALIAAKYEKARMHVMHVAVLIGLAGMGGTGGGAWKAVTMLGGAEVARPQATIAQAVMFVIMFTFVALCVKSFIDARRNKDYAAS